MHGRIIVEGFTAGATSAPMRFRRMGIGVNAMALRVPFPFLISPSVVIFSGVGSARQVFATKREGGQDFLVWAFRGIPGRHGRDYCLLTDVHWRVGIILCLYRVSSLVQSISLCAVRSNKCPPATNLGHQHHDDVSSPTPQDLQWRDG